MQLVLDLPCTVCPGDNVTAASGGSISGVDNSKPFVVTWTPPVSGTNLSGTVFYSSGCPLGPVWDGATINGGSFVTIGGASLAYNGQPSVAASVTLFFGGVIEPGFVNPVTTEITITGGPTTIDMGVPGIPGGLPLVPTSVTLCSGTQTFTASGMFLSFTE